MSFDLSAVNAYRLWQAHPARAAARADAPADGLAAGAPDAAVTADTFPSSPPPEVREEVLAAQRVVQDLYERGRELHFELADGRLRIELRDLDGNVLRTIPPFQALEIAGGKAVE